MAAVYRAFYAIRDLSTRDGRPTNAVFGFIRMLRQLREQWSPTHWAVVFDGGLPEARTRLLETYKAQRPAMPEALRAQLETVNAYLDGARVCALRVDGQEADDVMASLAAVAAPDAEVLLASNDKDLYQLVGGAVSMIALAGKGGCMGTEQVREKTGVAPDRIVDWLALVGDTSDNIPGVPGVGKKTAARLLDAHGSLDGIWDALETIERPRLREALRDARAVVERNQAMVRLDRGLDLFPGWDALAVRDEDPARVLPLLDALELDSLAHDLRQGPELPLLKPET
jgi:DNA polymerase I